jgi:hypothetical protein
MFHEPALDSRCSVLVLATRAQSNVHYRFIMPPKHYDRNVWYMEHAQPDQVLPAYDVVFNTIGDPDLAGPSADKVRRFLEENLRPLINLPERVQQTFRHLIPEILDGIDGVVAPKTARLDAEALGRKSLTQHVEALGFTSPILVRPVASHGGAGLYRADSLADLDDIAARLAGRDLYLTQYVDYAQGDGQYRKGRMILIDRRPLPYHWAISRNWMVHYATSDMADAGWRRTE